MMESTHGSEKGKGAADKQEPDPWDVLLILPVCWYPWLGLGWCPRSFWLPTTCCNSDLCGIPESRKKRLQKSSGTTRIHTSLKYFLIWKPIVLVLVQIEPAIKRFWTSLRASWHSKSSQQVDTRTAGWHSKLTQQVDTAGWQSKSSQQVDTHSRLTQQERGPHQKQGDSKARQPQGSVVRHANTVYQSNIVQENSEDYSEEHRARNRKL